MGASVAYPADGRPILSADSHPDQSDLAYLRGEVLGPLTLAAYAASTLLVYTSADAERLQTWLPIVVLAAVGAGARFIRRVGDPASAACLIVGSFVAVVVAVYAYPNTSTAFYFTVVVGVAGVLVGPWSCLGSAAAASVLLMAVRGTTPGVTDEVAYNAVALVWATGVVTWLATRPAHVALSWAWSSYLDSLRKTEELRDRQYELGRLSKSLKETCIQLELLNQDLVRTRLAADEARRLKNEFAAAVSHELRAPLNMIIGFSEMMVLSRDRSYDEPLPPSYSSDVEAIYRNACHISNLIDDILDLAQIDAHRMALRKEKSQVRTIVERAVASTAGLFRDKHLWLDIAIPADLPPVYVDPTRVCQVLINLLSNAARCTDTGGVTISAVASDGEVTVSVADTGVGLAAEDVPRAFEPFRQVGDPCRYRPGHGLGLAISKRLIEMHGGAMWADSCLGSGTTFHFSLPSQQNVVIPGEGPVREASLIAHATMGERLVLVLDEQGEASRLLERYLEGYRVVRVSSTTEARQVATKLPVRALLYVPRDNQAGGQDQVPEQTGIHGIPTVVCPLQMSRATSAELGAVGYLLKPITSAQLRLALGQLPRRPRSVLVIDDDPEVARLLAKMIRAIRRSCQVWEARDGRSGLELARVRRPDAVLLDLLMPDMDGYAVLKALRHDGASRDTPVIVISARGKEQEATVATSISIQQDGGFCASEAIRCIRASLDALLGPAASSSGSEHSAGFLA